MCGSTGQAASVKSEHFLEPVTIMVGDAEFAKQGCGEKTCLVEEKVHRAKKKEAVAQFFQCFSSRFDFFTPSVLDRL